MADGTNQQQVGAPQRLMMVAMAVGGQGIRWYPNPALTHTVCVGEWGVVPCFPGPPALLLHVLYLDS